MALPMELLPGIYRLEERIGPRYLFLYLLAGEHPLLVDTGLTTTPEQVIRPALAQLGLAPERLARVLITHADVDHHGGNAALKRLAPQAAFLAHQADQPWIEARERILSERYGWYAAHDLDYDAETWKWIRAHLGADLALDGVVEDGQWLELGGGRRVQVLHLPGHSPGHLGLWEPETRAAIIGDAVLERGLYDVAGKRIAPPPYFFTGAYLETIARLEALAPQHLLTAHYPALHGPEVGRFLAASRDFVELLRRTIVELLRSASGPLTLKELTAAADARVGPYTAFKNELAGPVRAHLEELVAAGQAGRAESAGLPAWRWLASSQG